VARLVQLVFKALVVLKVQPDQLELKVLQEALAFRVLQGPKVRPAVPA
jgi:hypothetical protein